MSKFSKNNQSLVTPVVISAAVAASTMFSGAANAQSASVDQLQLRPSAVAQNVTSVSQLSDVKPTDWAFTALQSLVERYGCIAGYPDRTFRGKQATSRYEFAAGLNACLDKINEIISAGLADKVSKEDLATLQKLQEEFAAELATLRGRVDTLEAKTAKLEAQQFSTITKLYGQAIFGLQGRLRNSADLSPRNGILTANEADPATNLTLGYDLQLNLLTQFDFHNRSLLLVGLRAANLTTGSGNIFQDNFTRLGYESNSANTFVLSDLSYRFMLGDNAVFIVGTEGVNPVTVFRGPNRVESAGLGPLSAFAQRNPILELGRSRAGVGFDWQIDDRISLQGIYAAGDPANPTTLGNGGGLFGSDYTLGGQLTLTPTDAIDVALYYLHAYTTGGSLKISSGDSLISNGGANFLTDAIGATLNWRLSPYLTLGTWGGYTKSNAVNGASGTVETTNWMVYLNLPDLFGRGNLGGIYVGQPPKIVSSNLSFGNLSFGNVPSSIGLNGVAFGAVGSQPASTTHVELFYRYRISDNISITPGVIFLFNPVHTSTSDTITIGTIRTTFTF
ncbi:MAG: iron uptake porin [Pseudanabaena sp.]